MKTPPAGSSSTEPAVSGSDESAGVSSTTRTTSETTTQATAVTSTNQAGAASGAPRGDLQGWRQVFVDDFAGSALGSGWGWPYDNDHQKPSNVSVKDGLLTLTASKQGDKWVTAGISGWPQARQYGKWDIRFRVDKSDEITYALLLWPSNESWPPEIDIAEDAGGDRSSTTATVHYGSGNRQIQHTVDADFSTWHTVGVEWTPGRLVYTLDGKPYATTTGSAVPSTPMWLGIQTGSGGCTLGYVKCPLAGTPAQANLQVDWVSIYSSA